MKLIYNGCFSPFPACCDAKEHLKPVVHKEPDSSSSSDHWAKRRKLFKESKQWSSTGASSITSDITEESGTFRAELGRITETEEGVYQFNLCYILCAPI